MQSAKTLGSGVKLAYGVGLAAEGIKNNAFNLFLLFFYQQLVGLDPALCGLALFVSLCADAVLDPAIGAWSDGLRSRFGRRHPFMYASIIPMSIAYVLVFLPPSGLSQGGKFLWLLVFSVITRVSMALFVIPHQSLVPELSSDSGERAALTSLRVVFAWIFGLVNSLLGFTVFLKSTPEYAQGLLNPKGYAPFAFFGAAMMFLAMVISSLFTQKAALERHTQGSEVHMPLRELPKAMRHALRTDSYRAVVLAGLFLFVGFGMFENLRNYLNTFFWGFTSQQIGGFILVILVASIFVLSIARPLLMRFGSRNVGMGCALLMATVDPTMVMLRLAGLLPKIGDPNLYRVLCVSVFIGYGGLMMSMTVVGKMIADVTDEYELITGQRQEGLLFSASMFLTKAASGLGTLASGVIIKAVQFPENATPATVGPELVTNLGLGAAVGGVCFGLTTCYFYSRFNLSHERHAQIVAELTRRRSGQVPADHAEEMPPPLAAYASVTE
jgi:GPH family glycoside/pentoside/hexuronide:cation symporter